MVTLTMAMIAFAEDGIEVDATMVAEGLRIDPPLVQERMREGKITTLCERGIGGDEGRHRLTFFSETRRFRILIDEEGKVLQRSAIDFGDQGLPASARKPGA